MISFSKNYRRLLLLLFCVSLSFFSVFAVPEDEKGFPEAKIKIAYLVNFLRFVEWPEESAQNTHICIVGYNKEYHDAVKVLESRTIKGENIVIREYSEKGELQDFRRCKIIFITSNAGHRQKIVANTIKGKNILTVGESEGFILHGGMINFISRDGSIHFEINLDAVKETELLITSKILRIADRVIHDADTR